MMGGGEGILEQQILLLAATFAVSLICNFVIKKEDEAWPYRL